MKTPPETPTGKPQLPRCDYAEAFEAIAKETIFEKLSPHTTPEQYDEAQKCLLLLRTELEQRMSPFHFHSPTGVHRCLADCYLEAVYRLKLLCLLRVIPALTPPTPQKQGITAGEVVQNLESILALLPQTTFLGDTSANQ